MPTPPISNQRPPQPPPQQQAAEIPPPAGATRIAGGQPANRPAGGTGGATDTFAPNGTRPPQYQDLQPIGRTGNGQNVVAGTEAGDFYCEHALFTSNEFAHQPNSSVAKDGNGDPLVTFIHHPGLLDDKKSPNRQAGAQEVVGATLRGYVDSARGQVPGNEPIKVLVTGYGEFQGIKNNPTQDFVTHPQNMDAAMSRGFGNQLVRNEDGTPKRETSTMDGQPVYRYQIRDQEGNTRNVDVMSALLSVDDKAIDGGSRSLQRLETDFRPNAVINQGVNPGGDAFKMETRADDGGMRRTGNMQFTAEAQADAAREGEWEYQNPSGANAFRAGQEAIQRDQTAAGAVPVSQLPVTRQISPS